MQPAEADGPAGEAHAATDQVLAAAAGHPQKDGRRATEEGPAGDGQ